MLIKHPVPRAVAASRQHLALRAGLPSAAAIARGVACRRTYAAAVATKTSSPASPFTVSDVNGIKVIARDDGGPTTGISVVLKAGARYAPIPGLAHLLDKFAWKNTEKRTAFRVTRETELLGGLLSSSSSRETVSVSAQCLRDDVPYFVEALGDVALLTKYTDYEFHDDVLPLAQLEFDAFQTNPVALAIDSVHSAAFHRGLGSSLLASPTIPIRNSQVIEYAKQAYSKANLIIVASGASAEELKPHIEQFWKYLPAGQALTSPASKFTGGESRISHRSSQNVFAISFPGSALYGSGASPELVVLSHLLGGVSPVKWSTGHSAFAKLAAGISQNVNLYATNIAYSDAGLFTILATGSAADVSKAASAAVKLLRDISKGGNALKAEDIKRAAASARYATYAATEARLSGLEPIGQSVLDTGKVVELDTVVSAFEKVTPDKLKQAAAKLLETAPSVAAVGQTHLLPFYDEL